MCEHIPLASKHLKRLLPAALITLCAGPAVAQQAAQLKPATPEELFTYSFMGAVSVCNSVQNGITDFNKAFQNSIAVSVVTIQQKHKSQIKEGDKFLSLSLQQMQNGIAIENFTQIERICGKEIKGENKKQYEIVKAEIDKALKMSETSKSK